jgi:hypothetical protein
VDKSLADTVGDIRDSRLDTVTFARPWTDQWPEQPDDRLAAWCAVRVRPQRWAFYAVTAGERPVHLWETVTPGEPRFPPAVTPSQEPRLRETTGP